MTNPSLKIGDGNWAYKEDNLLGYAVSPVNNKFLPREMTFARASDGTRVNEDGLVENMPFNLLQQSNTFNTTWTTNVGVFTSGQSGYDGTNDAWKFESNGGGTTFVLNTKSASGINTASIYAKAGNINYIRFGFNPSSESYGFFNLTSGGSVVSTSGSPIDAKIERVGTSDWYRCSIANNVNATGVVLYLSPDGSSLNVSNNAFVYIQDAQLNLGSTAKPYFPTTNRQDVPRIDYSSGTGALLLEPQRTNLALYSEQFDNAAWVKSNSGTGVIPVVTANQTISPDGTQNADKIILDKGAGATSADYSFVQQGTTISGDATASIWLKSATSSSYLVSLRLVNTISTVTVTPEWQRFTLTVTSTTNPNFGLWLRGGYGSSNYAEFYAWGAQVEAGSYATSYIPTTSSSVTRVGETLSKIPFTLTPTASMSWYIEAPKYIGSDGNNYQFRLSGAGLRYIQFRVRTDGYRWLVSDDAGSISYLGSGITSAYKGIVTFNGTQYRHYANGVLLGTFNATSSAVLNVLDSTSTGAIPLGQMLIFPTALTDAECIALTTL